MEGVYSWLSLAEQGNFSFLDRREFDQDLLTAALDDSRRVLQDRVALDNFNRAAVCLAMDDEGVDDRLFDLTRVLHPVVYALLERLQGAGLLGSIGLDLLGLARDLSPVCIGGEWQAVFPIYQLGSFAKEMSRGDSLTQVPDFFFQSLPGSATERLARYAIGIAQDEWVEQALEVCYLRDFFEDPVVVIHAAKWLLQHESDRTMLFLTVRFLWQQVCQPRNTFLAKFRSALVALSPTVRYEDLRFNPDFRNETLRNSLATKDYTAKLMTWCPALKEPGLVTIIRNWGRLVRPPYRKAQEEEFGQLVTDFLAEEGHLGWGISLLWLLGVIH